MNIYSKKQRWKLMLSLLAILICVASVFITNKLVKELKSEETKKIEIWAQATKQLVNSYSQGDFSLAIKVVSENRNIPVILIDECDSILETRNVNFFSNSDSIVLNKYDEIKYNINPLEKDSLTTIKAEKLLKQYKSFLRETLNEMKASGDEPIEINYIGDNQWIYYADSEV